MKKGNKIVKATLVCTALFALTLAGCGTQNTSTTTAKPAATQTKSDTATKSDTQTAATATSLKTQEINMTVYPGSRLGPDGKKHDTFSPADFTVVEGVPVKLTVYNYDDGEHTVTNSDLGLNLLVKGSKKKGVPGVSTITFTPTKTGDFEWNCNIKCDGGLKSYAMTTDGYMRGKIHVVPNTNSQQYATLSIKDGVHFAAVDGKLHDSYTPADLTVKAGVPVTVTVENFDTGDHSLTAPELGLNQIMKGASKEGVPTITTFTFTPKKAGDYKWHCAIECDGGMQSYGMTHEGYMQGTIHVVE